MRVWPPILVGRTAWCAPNPAGAGNSDPKRSTLGSRLLDAPGFVFALAADHVPTTPIRIPLVLPVTLLSSTRLPVALPMRPIPKSSAGCE